MKNKLKSVRSGSKSAASSQSKTQHGNAPAHSSGTVTCVWTYPDGREWMRVDFPRQLFSLITRAAGKLGVTLQQFFDNAVRSKVASHRGKGGA